MGTFGNYGGTFSQGLQPRILSIRSLGSGAGAGAAQGVTIGRGEDSSLMGMLQRSWDAARQANQARFAKILALAKQFGASQLADNQTATQQAVAQANQDMISRGFGNSSARYGIAAGLRNQGARTAAAINEKRAGLAMDALGQHEDAYPDLGLYASLFAAKRG